MRSFLFSPALLRDRGSRAVRTLVWVLLAGMVMVPGPGAGFAGAAETTFRLQGSVVDERTGQPLPARVSIRNAEGRWFFAESAHPSGSAVIYDKQNWVNAESVERHTTLSAHGFVADLPPGRYQVTASRGKEYREISLPVEVRDGPATVRLPLVRWIDVAERGWYSGDTHVHRTLAELPNLLLAEDLNVALPLTYWVTKAFAPPTQGDKNMAAVGSAVPIAVDATHVILPRNTEYELFSVGGRSHTLGAVFVLNHRTEFDLGAPPVGPIAERAHREGALLDLDKHDWPWSIALIPVMGIDLFELSNNHVWRTAFAFTNWNAAAPAWMGLPNDGRRGAEIDWVEYGLRTYYALLNCGFRLRPTAGTASGVHPVPLGFSRVYVHTGKAFSADAWWAGLKAGRSFVTTGPMLFVTLDDELPGHVFAPGGTRATYKLEGVALYDQPLERIELLVNGDVAATFNPANKRTRSEAYESKFSERIRFEGSAWLAVRCFERVAGGKARFAHTGPFHIEVADRPLRPRREEVQFFIDRVEQELARSGPVLPEPAQAEYRQALAVYRKLLEGAR